MEIRDSCGCEAGTWGVLAAIGLYLLVSVGLPMLLAEPVSATWGWGIAAAVGGGGVGKILGMWWARRRIEALRLSGGLPHG